MAYSDCYKVKFKEEYIPKIESFLNYSPDDKEIDESYEYFDKAPCGCEVICDEYGDEEGWDCLHHPWDETEPITKYLYCYVEYDLDSASICFRTDYTCVDNEKLPSVKEVRTLEKFFDKIIEFGKKINK